MTDIKELSFESAFAELETLVQQLETGNLPLDEAMALFERGTALVAHCNDKLDSAELKVHQLAPTSGGEEDEIYDESSSLDYTGTTLEEFLPEDDSE